MELKEKQEYFCLLITQHFSVNNILTLSLFFGYPSVLSHQTIAISMMTSMAIVLQIFFGCVVIRIKGILKLKRQTDLIWLFYLGNVTHNSLNEIFAGE